MKNYFNRSIRRKPLSHTFSGQGGYKKENCSYDICDWKSLYFGNKTQIIEEMCLPRHFWFGKRQTSLEEAEKDYRRYRHK